MAGYSGNVLLLYIGPAGQGVAGPAMLRTTGLYALCNAALTCALYTLEWRHERRVPPPASREKPASRAKPASQPTPHTARNGKHLTEPLLPPPSQE